YEELDLILSTIGLWFFYQPGTTIVLSGQFYQHGAGKVIGDRGVIVFYTRDNVHECMDVVRCNFMSVDNVPR
ncbi:hypothetical protein HD554DRAFT_2027438, partial [Boletus coccyginus]